MEQFLLISTNGTCKYRYFQNDEQNKYNIFLVEFSIGTDFYDRLYWWGREEDKSTIARFTICVYPPFDENEWRLIEMQSSQNISNFGNVISKALDEIERLKNSL